VPESFRVGCSFGGIVAMPLPRCREETRCVFESRLWSAYFASDCRFTQFFHAPFGFCFSH